MSANAMKGRYIRHPRSIPLVFRTIPREFVRSPAPPQAQDLGGLRFEALCAVPPGAVLELTVDVRGKTQTFRGTVHWTQPLGRRFEVGLRFTDPEDAFRARMAEQVCHIEAYRQRRSRQSGRAIGVEQAAHAWIRRYAMTFWPLPQEEPAGGS